MNMTTKLKHSTLSTIMGVAIFLSSGSSHAAIFGPANFGECVLEELKDVQNDQAARAALIDCLERFPGGFESIEPKNSFFDRLDSWTECVRRYGSDTSSEFAATRIRGTCVRFYPPETEN